VTNSATVAPDIAERRRSEAERKRARVTIFREESGAAGLSGRDLPTAQALSGHANILTRARQYEVSGTFPDHNASRVAAMPARTEPEAARSCPRS
jgi:integrase